MDRTGSRVAVLPETAAALAVRRSVRSWLGRFAPTQSVTVAVSGGPDSLALAAATVAESSSDVYALIVDHQLQADSALVADRARAAALSFGCSTAQVVAVEVGADGGLEAAARQARYEALDRSRHTDAVLLGHTLDDQAETVLLGLARGSGARSIAGMSEWDEPWGRPLLSVRRAQTLQLCDQIGLEPFSDPHNSDPRFTRVRLRHEVLPLLEQCLGGGVTEALGRTATQLQDDNAVLDELADSVLSTASDGADLVISALKSAPRALRTRAVRAWLASRGISSLNAVQLAAIDEMVSDWRGQGPVAVPGVSSAGRLVVSRQHDKLSLDYRG